MQALHLMMRHQQQNLSCQGPLKLLIYLESCPADPSGIPLPHTLVSATERETQAHGSKVQKLSSSEFLCEEAELYVHTAQLVAAATAFCIPNLITYKFHFNIGWKM